MRGVEITGDAHKAPRSAGGPDTAAGAAAGARAPRHTLPLGLVAGFCALAALLALGGYLVWLQQVHGLRAQGQKTVRAVAKLKAEEVTDWLDERRADAVTLAQDPLLSAAVSGLADGTAGATTRADVRRRLGSVRVAFSYGAVLAVTPGAEVLVASPAGTHAVLDPVERGLVATALATGTVQMSDLHLDTAGKPALAIAAPLLPATPGAARPGAVVMQVDPAHYLYPYMEEWPLPGSSGETVLVERRGKSVLYLSVPRYSGGRALTLTMPLDRDHFPAAAAALGKTGVMDGIDYRGVPVIAAFRPVVGTHWGVVAKLDRNEVIGGAATRGWVTGGVTALLVLLIGAATLYLWRGRELRAADAIGAGRKQFADLFAGMSEAVMLAELVTDERGEPVDYRIIDVNPQYTRLTGRAAEEARGALAGELSGQHPPAQLDRFAAVVAHGAAAHYAYRDAELDRYLEVEVVPQGDRRWATILTDDTERRRAEEALRESERKFRETVEDLDEGYFSVTRDGILLDHNPAFNRFVGIDPDEDLRGRPTPDFWADPADRAVWVAELMRAGVVRGWANRARTVDGRDVVAIVSAHLVRDESGAVARIDGTLVDYTAGKAAEEEIARLNAVLEQRVKDRTAELQAANRELEAFAYSVSHDLRAPLRHISGFSELLADREHDRLDDKSLHYLDVITRSVREMGVLIDDLLQFSRTGRVELQLTEVDMQALVRDAVQRLHPDTAQREVEWDIGPLPPVVGDRALLAQVWLNLLSNAVKYTRGRAPARIDIGALEGDVKGDDGRPAPADVFFVRDNGVGFDNQYAHKLFGVFQRLHTSEEFEGTGIGLANVHRIISRLGGDVWADGVKGEGAAFFFSLPRRKGAPS